MATLSRAAQTALRQRRCRRGISRPERGREPEEAKQSPRSQAQKRTDGIVFCCCLRNRDCQRWADATAQVTEFPEACVNLVLPLRAVTRHASGAALMLAALLGGCATPPTDPADRA